MNFKQMHLTIVKENSPFRPKKVNDMFLRHRPHHFQPPRIKNFYCIPTNKCEKLSSNHELSVQSGRHLPCLLVNMVGWLVELWCTHSRDSAPLIKSRKFLRNIVGTSFLFEKGKKNKNKKSPSRIFF